MSFKFSWDPNLINSSNFKQIASVLEVSLSRGPKPKGVVGDISVEDLQLGDIPPRLHMIEISELKTDRFKGVFSMVYNGNASITLSTYVQANTLMSHYENSPQFSMPSFASSLSSLIMPLRFTIYDFRLSGIITLVVSKSKGVILVFQDDPLESIKISSSLDSLPGIATQVKSEIEQELRLVFRDSIPEMLYKLTHEISKSSESVDFLEKNDSQLDDYLEGDGGVCDNSPQRFSVPPLPVVNNTVPSLSILNSTNPPQTYLSEYGVINYQALVSLKFLANSSMSLSLSSTSRWNNDVFLASSMSNYVSPQNNKSFSMENDESDDLSRISSQSSAFSSCDNILSTKVQTHGPRRVIKLRDALKKFPQSQVKHSSNNSFEEKADHISEGVSTPCTPSQSPRLLVSHSAPTPTGKARDYNNQFSTLSLSPVNQTVTQSPQLSATDTFLSPNTTENSQYKIVPMLPPSPDRIFHVPKQQFHSNPPKVRRKTPNIYDSQIHSSHYIHQPPDHNRPESRYREHQKFPKSQNKKNLCSPSSKETIQSHNQSQLDHTLSHLKEHVYGTDSQCNKGSHISHRNQSPTHFFLTNFDSPKY